MTHRIETAASGEGFTPGPHLVQREPDGDYTVWTRQPHTGTLATVHAEDINGEYPAKDNAHLFAAASDLYRALKSMLAEFDADEFGSEGQMRTCAEARDALAKAQVPA